MQGAFIVLEGPDGSGTTTHASILSSRLQQDGYDVLSTHEPTKGPIGSFIRLQLGNQTFPPDALQLLFTADRAWHLRETVLPALQSGKIVISDRYVLSTILYGTALGLDEKWLRDMNGSFVQPNLEMIALPSLDVCMQRLHARTARDMLEENALQKKVYDGYSAYAARHKTAVIDTSVDVDEASRRFYELALGVLPRPA